MAETIRLDVDLARDLAHVPAGESLEGWTVVHHDEISHGRWSARKRVVIRNAEGQHYAAHYEEGLTESQDYDSFGDGRETYPFTPVIARTRIVEVTEYVTPKETDHA